ncbi:MAG: hypothetical protein UDG94_01575 [Peptococcaceae bacterium]|nr:hypothetical protein [Peptococcaceae bacterium]
MKPKYEAILHQPHHVSKRHPPMARAQRAAQFAAFSALSGYDERIRALEQEVAAAEAEEMPY